MAAYTGMKRGGHSGYREQDEGIQNTGRRKPE